MRRVIPYIIILVICFGFVPLTRAQSDPKNPVQAVQPVNPSRFDQPASQADPKLTPEQRAAIEKADHSNPAKPPSSAPDLKKSTADPVSERPPVTVNPEPKQEPPDVSISTSEKAIQPAGGNPATITDYRAMKGSDTLQKEPGPKVPVTDYRNIKGAADQPPGTEIIPAEDKGSGVK
jgi:hypothetical protein